MAHAKVFLTFSQSVKLRTFDPHWSLSKVDLFQRTKASKNFAVRCKDNVDVDLEVVCA